MRAAAAKGDKAMGGETSERSHNKDEPSAPWNYYTRSVRMGTGRILVDGGADGEVGSAAAKM